MKYAIVIPDGAADEPLDELDAQPATFLSFASGYKPFPTKVRNLGGVPMGIAKRPEG